MSELTRTPDTSCILVCAGNASRMGGINKILMPLGDSNVVGRSMLAFEKTPDIAEIIVVTKPDYFDAVRQEAEKLGITKLAHLTEGGETRQQSVMQGLRLVSKESQYIAIHDGARPLVKPEHIVLAIRDARVFGGATLGVPVKDSSPTRRTARRSGSRRHRRYSGSGCIMRPWTLRWSTGSTSPMTASSWKPSAGRCS